MTKRLLLLLLLACSLWGFEKPARPNLLRKGKDFALFFAVNKYQNPKFATLTNPIGDAKRIALELQTSYGFQTEVVENPTYEMIEQKLQEYSANFASRKYDPEGQLLIFFSGHGSRKLTNGYFLPSNANPDDLKRSAFNYKIWRDDMDAIDCKHILVAIDACYSGSFDPKFGMKTDGLFGTRSGELTQGQRLIAEHEKHRTRLFFTSGESDQPTPDQSDFAKKFLAALLTKGYDDGILTSSETFSNHLEKAAPRPRTGEFGSDEAGSSFLFIADANQNNAGVSDVQRDAEAWGRAQTQNTLYAYREYVRQFPQGDFASQARRKITDGEKQEELNAWANAKAQNTPEAYNAFLNKYPQSVYAETAKERGAPAQPATTITTSQPFEPEMVFVKGGTFQMGSAGSEAGSHETPHSVTLSDYYIGKYEVTQAQWKSVMNNNPSQFIGDNLPVESVSWDDIQGYLQKLNQKTGKKYRLPTEAEWEFAARGGNGSKNYTYSGSNNIKEVAWYGTENTTHPIGTKKVNELGIFDMSGNVWEWCNDWYGADYYTNSPSQNPQGPVSGSGRVLRGGSWGSNAQNCRSSYRYDVSPTYRYSIIGFRVASGRQ